MHINMIPFWAETYKEDQMEMINKENYECFLGEWICNGGFKGYARLGVPRIRGKRVLC